MHIHKYMKLIIFTLSTIGLLILLAFIPTQTSLVFYKENTPEITAYLPIKQEQTFQIIFTHSIHLTDVIEKYKITKDKQIKQYEIVYEEFGIGMPSNAQEGEEFEYKDGKYHIKDLNNIFPSINIRNGKTVSKNRFIWEDANHEEHKVYFNDFFEPGAWFHVKVAKISLFQTWKEVKIHD